MTEISLQRTASYDRPLIKQFDFRRSNILLSNQVSRFIIVFALGATLSACSSSRSQRELVQEAPPEILQLSAEQLSEASPAQADEAEDEAEDEYSELDSDDRDDESDAEVENESDEEENEDEESETDGDDDESVIALAEPELSSSFEEGDSQEGFSDNDPEEQNAGTMGDDRIENDQIRNERKSVIVDQSIAQNSIASLDSSGDSQSEISSGIQADNSSDAPAAEDLSEGTTMARAAFSGGWSAKQPDGSSCRITLSMASAGNALSASSSGCTNPQLSGISAWDLRGDTVLLYRSGEGVAARLVAAPGVMSGLITESGQPLALSR